MLVDLIRDAAEITGIDAGATNRRELLVRKINMAAQELYDSYDLPGSLWEREFRLQDNDYRLVTVPWYVGLIKGVRRFQFSRKVQLVDPRPRYHYKPWRQGLFQWRIIGDTPLTQHMTQSGYLRARLDVAEEGPLTVTIKGQTNTADIAYERLQFPAGTTQLTTTNQWRKSSPFGIVSITKSARTLGNVHITQVLDGREVAVIPNCLKFSRNRLVQIHDGFHVLSFADQEHIEMLFKWFLVPLEEDEDQFLHTDIWDQAIIWKLREQWHSTREGEESLSVAAYTKCKDLVQQLAFTAESEVEKKIQTEDDPFALAALGIDGSSGGGPCSDTSTTIEDEDEDEDMRVLAVQGRVELRAITGYVDKELRYLEFLHTKTPNDGQGGEFVFFADNMVDDDEVDYLRPNDISPENPGRWIRQQNLS